jgi:hypothetical protein
MILTKRDRVTGKVSPVVLEEVFKEFYDTGSSAAPKDIRRVLDKGNPVATNNYVFQYLPEGEL